MRGLGVRYRVWALISMHRDLTSTKPQPILLAALAHALLSSATLPSPWEWEGIIFSYLYLDVDKKVPISIFEDLGQERVVSGVSRKKKKKRCIPGGLWPARASLQNWSQGSVEYRLVYRRQEDPNLAVRPWQALKMVRESLTQCRWWLWCSWEGLTSHHLQVSLWILWSDTGLLSHDWALLLRVSLVYH